MSPAATSRALFSGMTTNRRNLNAFKSEADPLRSLANSNFRLRPVSPRRRELNLCGILVCGGVCWIRSLNSPHRETEGAVGCRRLFHFPLKSKLGPFACQRSARNHRSLVPQPRSREVWISQNIDLLKLEPAWSELSTFFLHYCWLLLLLIVIKQQYTVYKSSLGY